MIIASIPKNAREAIVIDVSEYKGHHLVGCRVWAKNDDGDVPTRKGITLRVAHLPDVITALQKALLELQRVEANG